MLFFCLLLGREGRFRWPKGLVVAAMSESEALVSHFTVVRQEHLNQYGNLFGGYLLQVIDELAYVACMELYPGHHFVTRALNDVEFHAPARLGDILETKATLQRTGCSSAHIRVQVFICSSQQHQRRLSFDGTVIMVSIDPDGSPRPIRHDGAGKAEFCGDCDDKRCAP